MKINPQDASSRATINSIPIRSPIEEEKHVRHATCCTCTWPSAAWHPSHSYCVDCGNKWGGEEEGGEEERRSVGPTAKGRFPFCPDEKTFVGVAASLMSFVLVVSRIMFRQKKFGFGCFPLFSRFFWFFPRLIAFLALSLGINIYRFGNIQFCQWTCFGCFGRSLLYRCGRSLSVIAL